ncbi:MAG: transposase [Elusimicrobia bacterium]|nr:transposase [Candidatus Liberimonas magnetica]
MVFKTSASIPRESTNSLSLYCINVPYSTGGIVSHGRLISTCNHWLRYAFVEAAWAAIRSSPYFRALFSRMRKRKGPNVAIAVIARRLSEVIYRCLSENRNYEERPYNGPRKYAA